MFKRNKFVKRIAKNKRDDILPGPVAVLGMYKSGLYYFGKSDFRLHVGTLSSPWYTMVQPDVCEC